MGTALERADVTPTASAEIRDIQSLRSAIMIDGRYPPSSDELPEMMERVDLISALDQTELVAGEDSGKMRLQFDSLAHARLFELAIGAEGTRRRLFMFSSVGMFDEGIIDDTRLDGNQFSCSEYKAPQGAVRVSFRIKYLNAYRGTAKVAQYSSLIRDVTAATIPHLAQQTADFQFS